MKSKKKRNASGVLLVVFKTYTRYSWVADEEFKKKVLGVLNGCFWVVLLEEAIAFFNFCKGGTIKKFGKPWTI